MIKFKMHKGTNTDVDVCLDCSRLHKMVFKNNEEVKLCTYMDKRITGTVVNCNRHYPANLPTVESTAKISWNLRTDKKRNIIGFASPEETKILVKDGKMDKPEFIYDDD